MEIGLHVVLQSLSYKAGAHDPDQSRLKDLMGGKREYGLSFAMLSHLPMPRTLSAPHCSVREYMGGAGTAWLPLSCSCCPPELPICTPPVWVLLCE